ncbi:hypothetical protein KEM54_006311 [Ascosphaera aggregata]|nr:hypothetical protein KEM54_006311 [Ascosphaera aggregata]
MSDDDDFMQDSEQEEYDFEYEDDDDEEEAGDVGIENKYYNAKQLKADNPDEAISEFLEVPALEMDKGDWGFKSLKQATKLEYKLERFNDAVEHYKELLTYVRSAITRNYAEKSINNMLDYVEKSSTTPASFSYMEQFYNLTLSSFQTSNNERLWLKTNLKLAKLWLDRKEYTQLTRKVRELHRACQLPDGRDDPSKGTYSQEIYALEIQMYAATKNSKRLKDVYQRALRVKSGVPHPKIMGIIHECGGKMNMSEENWKGAQSDFFESFCEYDEAGSIQRIQVLKYLVLATMLMKSDINPFDSQETKPYQTDPRILPMTNLVDAYMREDVDGYEKCLAENQELLKDPFIAENIDEVSRDLRTKAVLKLVAPYSRFKLDFVARKAKIPVSEVQDILMQCILDGRLSGARIDQSTGIVEASRLADKDKTDAIRQLSDSLKGFWKTVMANGEGFSPAVDKKPSRQALQLLSAQELTELGYDGTLEGTAELRGKGKGRSSRKSKGRAID